MILSKVENKRMIITQKECQEPSKHNEQRGDGDVLK